MRNLTFHLMAALFWFRYRSALPREAIAEAGVKSGDTVLDFGCGPGGFTLEAARVVGKKGKVFALDILPVSARYVEREAAKRGLKNIETITSGQETGLRDGSVDVILLYDILHGLEDPGIILEELHRVLKSDGRLSVTDHHLKENRIVTGVTESGLFRLEEMGKRTYTFTKAPGRKRGAQPA